MFTSKGLFKAIACPNQDDCSLPACWFLHQAATTPDNGSVQEYDPFSAGAPESPPTKRRKLTEEDEESRTQSSATRAITPPDMLPVDAKPSRQTVTVPTSKQGDYREASVSELGPKKPSKLPPHSTDRTVTPPPIQSAATTRAEPRTQATEDAGKQRLLQLSKPNQAAVNAGSARPKSMERPVSPPTIKSTSEKGRQAQPIATQPPQTLKTELLNPRRLGPGPALHKSRINFLKALHQQMLAKNGEVVKAGPKANPLRLAEQEMITLALDEEEKLARSYDAGIYQNMVRQRAHAIKTMDLKQWESFVSDHVARLQRIRQKPTPKGAQQHAEGSTGMKPEEELAVLRQLQQPLVELQQYGYVTRKPSEREVTSAQEAAEASANWEQCDRCGTRFQVFPGRDEQGRLASGGECRYHWAKAGHRPQTKAGIRSGESEDKHGCCNQPFGSDGCTSGETHVFNVKDRNRLASHWQWERTPEQAGTKKPVSFDCEMCYTTLGMEVVRVTAVSWPDNGSLLDVLVRPSGEVLDLNTRFSGVSKKLFAEALAYGSELDNDDGTGTERALRKVASPVEARQLLFDLMTPTTPLIGHAIENDLNTLRTIHPFVIDTVLIYPHRQGLPRRNGLRILALDKLGRRIQAGQGHDSKEDAIATGDLVTLAVKNKWRNLQASGWEYRDGGLVQQGEGNSKL